MRLIIALQVLQVHCSLPTILTALHTHEHEHAHAHTCTSTCTCTIPPPYPSSTVRSRTREDRFHHNDRSRAQRGGIGASLQQGVVMSRKKTETQRLPDACYDVRPALKDEAAWPQLTATDCLHVSRLYPRCAPRAHIGVPARSARYLASALRACGLASALRACVQLKP